MRLLFHPERQHIELPGVLYALGDPVRLEIVCRLAQVDELPCADLNLAIAKSTLSHHFKILRESGIVQTRRLGTHHLNSLRRQDLDQLFPGLLEAILQAAQNSPSREPRPPADRHSA